MKINCAVKATLEEPPYMKFTKGQEEGTLNTELPLSLLQNTPHWKGFDHSSEQTAAILGNPNTTCDVCKGKPVTCVFMGHLPGYGHSESTKKKQWDLCAHCMDNLVDSSEDEAKTESSDDSNDPDYVPSEEGCYSEEDCDCEDHIAKRRNQNVEH